MRKVEVIIGQRINFLTVIGEAESGPNGHTRVFCKCDCDTVKSYQYSYLKLGKIKSCGCFQKNRRRVERITHDMSSTRLYRVYQGMIQRCTNPKTPQYKNYGGRGITVCARWLKSFENFYADMGDRPSSSHSLDRYPNMNGNYKKSNCRWATRKEQSRNRRNNKFFKKNGLKMTQTDWSLYFGVSRNSVSNMIRSGKTFNEVYDFYSKNKL